MLLTAAAMVTADPLVLVRGEIIEEKFIGSDDIFETEPETITIGGLTRVRVRVRQTLIGHLPPHTRSIVTVIPIATKAKGRRDIYLLVERDGVKWRGVHWDNAKEGICIPDNFAIERGIDQRVSELKKKGIVICD